MISKNVHFLIKDIYSYRCETSFCFYHSTAHPNTTCEDYIASHSKEILLNEEFLSKTCKPCPQCGNVSRI